MALDRSAAHLALRAFCEAMNPAYAGRYWAMAGTLLGIVRENDFIAHDGDIDFGMYAADYSGSLVRRLEEHGFVLRRRSGAPDNGLILKLLYGATKVDIFFFYPDGERIWHALSRSPGRIRASFEKFAVAPRLFQGVALYVPDPVEAVLTANYGPDWRRPVKRWHYAYSAHNISVHGPAYQRLGFWVKNGFWQVKSRVKALVRR